MRRMVSTGTPQRSETFSADHSASMKRSAISVKAVTTRRPSGILKRPMSFGAASGDRAGMGEFEWLSHTSAEFCALRTNSPSSAPPSFSTMSHGELV